MLRVREEVDASRAHVIQRRAGEWRVKGQHLLAFGSQKQRARSGIGDVVVSIFRVVDAISPGRRRPTLQCGELRHQPAIVDQPNAPARE